VYADGQGRFDIDFSVASSPGEMEERSKRETDMR
jgi:hypothetical protein